MVGVLQKPNSKATGRKTGSSSYGSSFPSASFRVRPCFDDQTNNAADKVKQKQDTDCQNNVRKC